MIKIGEYIINPRQIAYIKPYFDSLIMEYRLDIHFSDSCIIKLYAHNETERNKWVEEILKYTEGIIL